MQCACVYWLHDRAYLRMYTRVRWLVIGGPCTFVAKKTKCILNKQTHRRTAKRRVQYRAMHIGYYGEMSVYLQFVFNCCRQNLEEARVNKNWAVLKWTLLATTAKSSCKSSKEIGLWFDASPSPDNGRAMALPVQELDRDKEKLLLSMVRCESYLETLLDN